MRRRSHAGDSDPRSGRDNRERGEHSGRFSRDHPQALCEVVYRISAQNRGDHGPSSGHVFGTREIVICKSCASSRYAGAGGGGRTHMPSEGRGILSPVRLPVPPLQQLYGSFEFTPRFRNAHCSGSCSGSRPFRACLSTAFPNLPCNHPIHYLTRLRGAARSLLSFRAYSSRRSPAL